MTAIERLPQDSFLLKLDPRTKILLTPFFTLLVFVVDKPLVAAGQMIALLVLGFAAKMPLKKIFAYIKFVSFLVVVIILLQMLFGAERHDSHYLLKPIFPEQVPLIGGRGSLKREGLFTGLMISCRLVALIVLMPMLTSTTEPRLLTLGFTRLGLHYRAAYIITAALNLVPSFEEEARAIMDARRLRGTGAFEKRGSFARLKEYPAIALPLIINAMRRAQMMGIVMDSRAFGFRKTKTWLITARITHIDRAAFAIGAGYAVIALALNFLL
ncbi:MAG: energy-coupling factor transporter transmembrane protein EcfT [Treponema sp.]|jgi:energy-coupling factor transport system permease protein|nr:energy-coupling factor transporter transmembrane protein EcfT [Treponema sp.]